MKTIISIFFLCSLVLGLVSSELSIGLKGSKSMSECRKFTVDKCNEESIFETVGNVPDVQTCQFYCNTIFSDHCTFFMLDVKQKLCMIMDQNLATYVNSCQKVVGPKTPSLSQCQSSGDPCDQFVEGYCQYEGTIMEHFDGLDANKCQLACSINPNCQVFIFDGSSGIQNCEIMGQVSASSCDLIRGPPFPDYNNCL